VVVAAACCYRSLEIPGARDVLRLEPLLPLPLLLLPFRRRGLVDVEVGVVLVSLYRVSRKQKGCKTQVSGNVIWLSTNLSESLFCGDVVVVEM
jgi:hypothetical protein